MWRSSTPSSRATGPTGYERRNEPRYRGSNPRLPAIRLRGRLIRRPLRRDVSPKQWEESITPDHGEGGQPAGIRPPRFECDRPPSTTARPQRGSFFHAVCLARLQDLPPWTATAPGTSTVPGTCPIPRIGTGFAAGPGMLGTGKRFVYILRSDVDPSRHYVGVTSDAGSRLEWHSRGPCEHTAERRPWSLVVIIEFPTEQQALRFERYPEIRIRPRLRDATLR